MIEDQDELHELIKSDPDTAWPRVLAFVRRHPESAAGVDFIQDFVYEHDTRFIGRIEAAALEDPIVLHVVELAYVGGFASDGAEQFRDLQERLTSRRGLHG